jgi:uncharacterized protein
MLKALNAALIALSLICPGRADAQEQPDPDAVAVATELITTMRITDSFIRTLPEMIQVLKRIVARGRPEIERDFDVAAPAGLDATKARIPELMAPIAGVYARNFTVSEMREVTAFYRKPTGQKFLDKSSFVTRETGMISQNLGNEVGREMHQRMIEELRKLGHKL